MVFLLNKYIRVGIVIPTIEVKFEHVKVGAEASFPAKANSSVVFPEPGGPKRRVILQKPQERSVLEMHFPNYSN